MAEDPKKAEAPNDIEVKKSKEGKLILVVAILAILVIILTPAITLFVLKSYNPVEKQAEKVTKEEHEKPMFEEVKLPSLKCNVSGTKGTRFLVFQVTLKVDPVPEKKEAHEGVAFLFTAKKAGGEKEGEGGGAPPINLLSQANAKLLEIMGNLTLDELDTPNAKSRIAMTITKAMNELKNKQAPKIEGHVQDAYFEDFFIQ